MKTVIKFAQCFYFSTSILSLHLYSGSYFHYCMEAALGIEIPCARTALSSLYFSCIQSSQPISNVIFPTMDSVEWTYLSCSAVMSYVHLTYLNSTKVENNTKLGRKSKEFFSSPSKKCFWTTWLPQASQLLYWVSNRTNSNLFWCWMTN